MVIQNDCELLSYRTGLVRQLQGPEVSLKELYPARRQKVQVYIS